MAKLRKTKDKNPEMVFECPKVVFRLPGIRLLSQSIQGEKMGVGSWKKLTQKLTKLKPKWVFVSLKHCDWATRTVTAVWSYCAQNFFCLGSRVNCVDLTSHYQESIGLQTKYMEVSHV